MTTTDRPDTPSGHDATHTIENVVINHILGSLNGSRALVQLEVHADGLNGQGAAISFAQLNTATARRIGFDLLAAAARSEYEQDFAVEAAAAGFETDLIGGLLMMVRNGEAKRESSEAEPGGGKSVPRGTSTVDALRMLLGTKGQS